MITKDKNKKRKKRQKIEVLCTTEKAPSESNTKINQASHGSTDMIDTDHIHRFLTGMLLDDFFFNSKLYRSLRLKYAT